MPNLFYAQLSREISLKPRASVPTSVQFLLGMIAPTLLPSKLESGESIVTNIPQRMQRQFWYDHGVVWMIKDNCVNVWEAESRFIGDSRTVCWGAFP